MPQPPGRKTSQEDIDEMWRLKDEGNTPEEIAEATGWSESTVKLKLYGSGTRRPPTPPSWGLPEEPSTPDPAPTAAPPPTSPSQPTAPAPPVVVHVQAPAAVPQSAPAAPQETEAEDTEPWGDSQWGMYGGEFHQLFEQVLKTLACPKEKRVTAVQMVRLNPQYHTLEQLRSLLTDMKVPGNMANRAAEMTMSMFNQQAAGYNQPYGQPTPPGAVPHPGYPGHPAPGHPAQPHPGYPNQPYPGWGYPPPYYPPPPTPATQEKKSESMTPEKVAELVAAERRKWDEERETDTRFATLENAIRGLSNQLKDTIADKGVMIEEPMRGPDGNVLVDPEGKTVYRRIPVSHIAQPQAGVEAQMMTLLTDAMSKLTDIKNQPPIPTGLGESERKLIEAQNKNDILQLQNNITSQMGQIGAQNQVLADRLQAAQTGGLTEDGRIYVEELRQRNDNLRTGIDKIGNLGDRVMGMFESAMQQTPHPAGYDDVPQYTPAELRQARQFIGDD